MVLNWGSKFPAHSYSEHLFFLCLLIKTNLTLSFHNCATVRLGLKEMAVAPLHPLYPFKFNGKNPINYWRQRSSREKSADALSSVSWKTSFIQYLNKALSSVYIHIYMYIYLEKHIYVDCSHRINRKLTCSMRSCKGHRRFAYSWHIECKHNNKIDMSQAKGISHSQCQHKYRFHHLNSKFRYHRHSTMLLLHVYACLIPFWNFLAFVDIANR